MSTKKDKVPQEITDWQFVEQLEERLKRQGMGLVLIDRRLLSFLKYVISLLAGLAVVYAFYFGFSLEEFRIETAKRLKDLEKISKTLDVKQASLLESQISLEAKQIEMNDLADKFQETARNQLVESSKPLAEISLSFARQAVTDATLFDDLLSLGNNFELPGWSAQVRGVHAIGMWETDKVAAQEIFNEAISEASEENHFLLAANLLKSNGERIASSTLVGGSFDPRTHARKKYERALDFYAKSAEDGVDTTVQRAEVHGAIGRLYSSAGDNAAAVEEFKLARELILTTAGSKDLELSLVKNLADAYLGLGARKEALEAHSEMVLIAEDNGDFDHASRGALAVARLTEDLDATRESLCAAISFYEKAPPEFKRREIFNKEVETIIPDFFSNEFCSSWEK